MDNLTDKMSVMRILFLFLLSAFHNNCFSANKSENVTIFACLDETECNDSINIDTTVKNTIKDIDSMINKSTSSISQYALNSIDNVKNINLTTSLPRQFQTTSSPSTTSTLTNEIIVPGIKKNFTVQKVSTEICECDLTVSSCDINCCCDSDCKESHISVFSHCMDHRAKLYDSRYCYNSNFIEYNNTQFVLEKLASNLFCIVYDNLPPAYSTSYDLDIKNREALNDAIRHLDRSKFKWQWEIVHVEPQFNITRPYRVDDVLWKLQANFIKPIEMLQTGFTGLCSFKKTLKYLRNWKGSCLQTDLTNNNAYLLPVTFNNFTVIASPLLFNEMYASSDNQTCPRNVCLPVESHYCLDSWNFCNSTESSTGSCSGGICKNTVKSVRYVILHNGTMGVSSLDVYFKLANITDKFYQDFEVIYEWVDTDKEKIFVLSGNPGYNVGKPIIIGNLMINKTNNVESKYVNVNKTHYFLTLPMGQKSGECDELKRYVVGFGEDIKLRCAVTLRTNDFTTRTCMEIQNRTFETLLQQSLHNITEINQYNIYISKLGRIDVNDTSSWVQIFLDRIPQNVITGHIIDDQIRCSGLVTSLRIDILHSLLSKPQTVDKHKILGISITFSDEVDVFWPKCTLTKNCVDLLKVDIVSYVAFHDASKPSKYYFASGPNLDISLPYDFFYPFLSSCKCNEPSLFLLSVLTSIGAIFCFICL